MDEKTFGFLNTNKSQSLESDPFHFRAYHHSGNSGNQAWAVSLKDISYKVNGRDISSDIPTYIHPEISIKLKKRTVKREDWLQNDRITGKGSDLRKKGRSGPLTLKLSFSADEMKNMPTGKHRIELTLRGEDTYSATVYRDMVYAFEFDISDEIQISGLEDVDLGIFPNHKIKHEQTFCVYRRPFFFIFARNIGISGTSSNGGSDFFLKNGQNRIKYTPKVAVKANPSGIFELTQTLTIKDSSGRALRGNRSRTCNKDDNMLLVINLDESFENLSTKPAGNYTDTLTITVSPE